MITLAQGEIILLSLIRDFRDTHESAGHTVVNYNSVADLTPRVICSCGERYPPSVVVLPSAYLRQEKERWTL